MTSTDLKTRDPAAMARPLTVLAPLIRRELEAGDAAGLEHYRKVGEMLLEAKEQCEYGEWLAWIERNFHLSRATANRYMKLASAPPKIRGAAQSVQAFTEPNRTPRTVPPPWQAPVQKVVNQVNMKAIVADQQSKAKEQKLMHDLAMQLIDIGYKVLAAKLHPDKGGSTEAMARLNKVKAILKGAI